MSTTDTQARTLPVADAPQRRAAATASSEGRHAPAVWGVTRIALGFVFFWAFVDKLFGLGYATPSERAWLNGGSPTAGFLGGVEGPSQGSSTRSPATHGPTGCSWSACSASVRPSCSASRCGWLPPAEP